MRYLFILCVFFSLIYTDATVEKTVQHTQSISLGKIHPQSISLRKVHPQSISLGKKVHTQSISLGKKVQPVQLSFDQYCTTYRKVYIGDEYKKHKAIYENNAHKIEMHNRNRHTYKMNINCFTDQSREEMEHLLGFRNL